MPHAIVNGKARPERHGSRAVLELLATDPGSTKDFQSLHRLAGHGVESQTLADGSFRHCITKAAL